MGGGYLTLAPEDTCAGCGRTIRYLPDLVCKGYPGAPGHASGPIPNCGRLYPPAKPVTPVETQGNLV